jgi:hypothetical protein
LEAVLVDRRVLSGEALAECFELSLLIVGRTDRSKLLLNGRLASSGLAGLLLLEFPKTELILQFLFAATLGLGPKLSGLLLSFGKLTL